MSKLAHNSPFMDAIERSEDYALEGEQPGRKIITVYEFPPIPDRRFDWCAYRAGDEESGPYGHGPTEAAAIADLATREDEAT